MVDAPKSTDLPTPEILRVLNEQRTNDYPCHICGKRADFLQRTEVFGSLLLWCERCRLDAEAPA